MKKRFLLFLLAALLLSACAAPAVPETHAPSAENRLVIYTSHKEDVYRPLIREFEERTGIWVELVTGGTSELLERIDQERAAPKCDVMFGGGVESLESYRRCFQSVRSAEDARISEPFREPAAVWAPFSALPVVLIYNTKLVAPGDLTGWSDLLRPEFQGRIAYADPSRSGSSFTALATAVLAYGEDVLDDFARSLEGRQTASSGEVLSAVADGSCLVGITLEETALQRIATGDNIAMVYPADGTSCVPDGTAVVADCPHRDNAVKFLDFTLSMEVQTLLGSRFYRRSVRDDVAAPEALLPMEQICQLDYNTSWAVENRDRLLSRWEQCRKEAEG